MTMQQSNQSPSRKPGGLAGRVSPTGVRDLNIGIHRIQCGRSSGVRLAFQAERGEFESHRPLQDI